MDVELIRGRSIQQTKRFGITGLDILPLLDLPTSTRSPEEVLARTLAMNAVAAASYGFDKSRAVAWLEREKLTPLLCRSERDFLCQNGNNLDLFKAQVEGMWTLCWAMGIVRELDFAKDCDDRFVTVLPDLKQNAMSADFRQRARPRPLEEIVQACDTAYCLHWAIREAELGGKAAPARLKPYLVVERRRALEWFLYGEPWDEVTLDT